MEAMRGVPNRIRTGVAAVKEGLNPHFERLVDSRVRYNTLKSLHRTSKLSTRFHDCLPTSLPYICRTASDGKRGHGPDSTQPEDRYPVSTGSACPTAGAVLDGDLGRLRPRLSPGC